MASRRSQPKTKQEAIFHALIKGAPKFEFKVPGQFALLYAVQIAPEMAEGIIEHCNQRNRRIRQTKVSDFSQEISDGAWRLQDTLRFSETGELIDGQHRLRAVIDADQPCNFLVQVIDKGEEKESNRVTDSGVPRNLGDYLHFNDVPMAERAASMLVLERNERISGSPLQTSRGTKKDYLAVWKELGEELCKTAFSCVPRGLSARLGVRSGFLDWYALRLCRLDPTEAACFMELLWDGSQQKKSDPTYILREKLIEMDRKKKAGRLKIDLTMQAHMIAKGWRLHANNQPAKSSDITFRACEDWPGIAGEE